MNHIFRVARLERDERCYPVGEPEPEVDPLIVESYSRFLSEGEVLDLLPGLYRVEQLIPVAVLPPFEVLEGQVGCVNDLGQVEYRRIVNC